MGHLMTIEKVDDKDLRLLEELNVKLMILLKLIILQLSLSTAIQADTDFYKFVDVEDKKDQINKLQILALC